MTWRQHTSSCETRERRISNILYWILMIGGCAVFLLMNLYTTAKEDDLFHAYIGGGSGRPIDSLLDVFRSWVEYYRHDARMANIISFIFNGLLGKPIFNVCNMLVFGVMAHMVSRMATGRNSAMALVMLFTYMVTAMPVPGETMLWVTGAFNYLWNFTASLLLIAYLLWHRDKHPGLFKGLALLLVSMFIGGINEGTTFGVFGGLVLYYLFNRDKVDRTIVLILSGYLLGIILLLTCPGAWQRASEEVTRDAGFMSLLADRCRLVLDKSLHYVTPAAAVVVLLVSLFVRGFRKTFCESPIPLVFLVLLAFVFVLGKDQQRLYFAVSMAGLILVVMAVYALLHRSWWLRLAVVVAGLALCVKYYPANIAVMKQYRVFFNQVDGQIKQTPGRQVVLKMQQFDGYSRLVKYFNFNSWDYLIREETLCYYYDKDNVQFVPDTLYERYHGERLLEGAVPVAFSSPDCKDIEAVFAVPVAPGPDYLAVRMAQDTISRSYQLADAYNSDGTRRPFPVPYFPVLYQGHEYLIFPMNYKGDSSPSIPRVDNNTARLSFCPYMLEGDPITLMISPSASDL